ncbi:MAG: class I SAM-dependent methyltransferase, partial [Acidimicrobiales bacterium]
MPTADTAPEPPPRPGHVYTHGHHESVLRSHRWRTADNSAAYLLPHLRPGVSILDVGCGPGTITVDLARRVAPGRVVGVDVAAGVVERARATAREQGVDNVEFVVGDLDDLEPDRLGGSFDVVHAHQVLQHLIDPVGAMRTMAGLAAGGGLVAARDSDYPAMSWAPPSAGLDRWLDLYVEVTRSNDAHADAGRHLPRWAREAGLGDVRYTTSTWTFATPEDRTWWGDLWAERVVSSALAGQAMAYGLAARADLDEVAEAWRAWST